MSDYSENGFRLHKKQLCKVCNNVRGDYPLLLENSVEKEPVGEYDYSYANEGQGNTHVKETLNKDGREMKNVKSYLENNPDLLNGNDYDKTAEDESQSEEGEDYSQFPLHGGSLRRSSRKISNKEELGVKSYDSRQEKEPEKYKKYEEVKAEGWQSSEELNVGNDNSQKKQDAQMNREKFPLKPNYQTLDSKVENPVSNRQNDERRKRNEDKQKNINTGIDEGDGEYEEEYYEDVGDESNVDRNYFKTLGNDGRY